MATEQVHFGVVGLEHPHVLAQVALLEAAGGVLAGWVPGPGGPGDLSEGFARLRPDAPRFPALDDLLGAPEVTLLVGAPAPAERAEIALRALRAGKDVLVDKPGAIRLSEVERLREAVRATGRRWWVFFSEHVASPATLRAEQMVREGALGELVHAIALGPHRIGAAPRPAWFHDRDRSGGILGDLASHAMEQVLALFGDAPAEVAWARTANHAHPEHPAFDDLGEAALRVGGGSAYVRVDWLTPDGLPTWGDVRLLLTGSEATLEVRKTLDPGGAPGSDHLILVDRTGVHRLAAADAPVRFGQALLRDVATGSSGALPVERCLRATELALRAEALAREATGSG